MQGIPFHLALSWIELILGKGKITVEGSSTDYFCIIASNDELNEDIPEFTVLYTNLYIKYFGFLIMHK